MGWDPRSGPVADGNPPHTFRRVPDGDIAATVRGREPLDRQPTGNGLGRERVAATVPSRVERTDPDGVDFGWVMQVTFVLGILVGAPLVAVLSLSRPLPTWETRVLFAVRVGALVWLVTAVGVYAYARRYRSDSADRAAP